MDQLVLLTSLRSSKRPEDAGLDHWPCYLQIALAVTTYPLSETPRLSLPSQRKPPAGDGGPTILVQPLSLLVVPFAVSHSTSFSGRTAGSVAFYIHCRVTLFLFYLRWRKLLQDSGTSEIPADPSALLAERLTGGGRNAFRRFCGPPSHVEKSLRARLRRGCRVPRCPSQGFLDMGVQPEAHESVRAPKPEESSSYKSEPTVRTG